MCRDLSPVSNMLVPAPQAVSVSGLGGVAAVRLASVAAAGSCRRIPRTQRLCEPKRGGLNSKAACALHPRMLPNALATCVGTTSSGGLPRDPANVPAECIVRVGIRRRLLPPRPYSLCVPMVAVWAHHHQLQAQPVRGQAQAHLCA